MREVLSRAPARARATGWVVLSTLATVCFAVACGGSSNHTAANRAAASRSAAAAAGTPVGATGSITVASTAFADGAAIPTKYTCDGQGASPPLSWSGAPGNARAFALIVDDPDAPSGVFTHWVVYNLPGGTAALAEGQPASEQLAGGGRQGRNGAGRTGYTGPCPPAGSPHHYRFTVYALDGPISPAASPTKEQVLQAMQGHIVGQGLLTGTYQRQAR